MTLARFEDAPLSEWQARLQPLASHLVDLLPALCVLAHDHEVPEAGAQDAVAVSPDGDCVLLTCADEPVTAVPSDLTERWAWFAERRDELGTWFPAAGFDDTTRVRAALVAPGFAPRLLGALGSSPLGDLHLIRVRLVGDGERAGLLVEDALQPGRPVFGADREIEPEESPQPEPGTRARPESHSESHSESYVETDTRSAPDSAPKSPPGPPPEVAAFRSLRPLGARELETRCAHRLARLDPALTARRDGDTTRFVLQRQTVATLLDRADHLELAVPGNPPFMLRAADDLEPALLTATRRYFDLLAPTRARRRSGLSAHDLIDEA